MLLCAIVAHGQSSTTQPYAGGCQAPSPLVASAVEGGHHVGNGRLSSEEVSDPSQRARRRDRRPRYGEHERHQLDRDDCSTLGGAGSTTKAPSPSEFAPTKRLADIFLDFDGADIRPSDRKVLDDNAIWMEANGKALILIEGHADERGTDEYNLALAERRAEATRNYLVAQGVASARINLISYGEERPFCTEHESCWSSKSGGPLPGQVRVASARLSGLGAQSPVPNGYRRLRSSTRPLNYRHPIGPLLYAHPGRGEGHVQNS